ncbi:MAG: uracil-DNA glycosylase family protein [Pseudomonadales bacterium]|jgi:uracil-DNA glycosylase|nr:uracil-DNA glycosylase family protein [Pseudomonadales bacterium]
MSQGGDLLALVQEIQECRHCAKQLPQEPRPVLRVGAGAKLLIIGQAPGAKVHASGIPWDDASGDRLREWLGMDKTRFYDTRQVAIMPMGFCYPGKGSSGDLPPRPECAPLWHQKVLQHLPNLELILLVGSYAQQYYLSDKLTLTERVRRWREYGPRYLPLVHPSPRNRLWLARNPWFEAELVPELRERLRQILGAG